MIIKLDESYTHISNLVFLSLKNGLMRRNRLAPKQFKEVFFVSEFVKNVSNLFKNLGKENFGRKEIF